MNAVKILFHYYKIKVRNQSGANTDKAHSLVPASSCAGGHCYYSLTLPRFWAVDLESLSSLRATLASKGHMFGEQCQRQKVLGARDSSFCVIGYCVDMQKL